MFGTDPVSGLFGKIKKQLLPTFAPTPTNVNPHKRTGTMPRLRHFNKKGQRCIIMPANAYSQKELGKQQLVVSDYHKRQRNQKNLNKQYNRLKKQQRHEMIVARREHKANKPVFVED